MSAHNQRGIRKTMIYGIQNASNGTIKIGVSENARRRFIQLQSATADKLIFLGVIAGQKDDEQAIHEKFKQYHVRGEWYECNEEIRDIFAPNWTDRLLRVEDVARQLVISPYTVRKMAREGIIKGMKITINNKLNNSVWRFRANAITEYIIEAEGAEIMRGKE